MKTQKTEVGWYENDYILKYIDGKPEWVLIEEPEPEFAEIEILEPEPIEIMPPYPPFAKAVGSFTLRWSVPVILLGYCLSWVPYLLSAFSVWLSELTAAIYEAVVAVGTFVLFGVLPILLAVVAAAQIVLYLFRRGRVDDGPPETPEAPVDPRFTVNAGGTIVNVFNNNLNPPTDD